MGLYHHLILVSIAEAEAGVAASTEVKKKTLMRNRHAKIKPKSQ
jgi:hypothetical protein